MGSAAWLPITLYTAGSIVQAPDGSWLSADAEHISGLVFDEQEALLWTPVDAKEGTVARAALNRVFASKSMQDLIESGRLNDFILTNRFGISRVHVTPGKMREIGIGAPVWTPINQTDPSWLLPKTAQAAVAFSARIPYAWETFQMVVYFANATTDTGNVLIRVLQVERGPLADLNSTAGATSSSVAAVAGAQWIEQSAVLFPGSAAIVNNGNKHVFRIIRPVTDPLDTKAGGVVITGVDFFPKTYRTFEPEIPETSEDLLGRTFTAAMNSLIPAGVKVIQQSPPPASDDDSAETFKLFPANVFLTTQDFSASIWTGPDGTGELWDLGWGNRRNYEPGQTNNKPNYLWGSAFKTGGYEVRTTFTTIARANLATRARTRHMCGVSPWGTYFSHVSLAKAPDFYWRFNDTSGTAAVDATGNGKDGTIGGSPALNQPGLEGDGKAIAFDGADDQVLRTFTTAATTGAVAALVKTAMTPSGDVAIAGRSGTSVGQYMTLGINSTGKPYALFRTATTSFRATGPTSINDNAPHYLVAVLRSDNMVRLYVDGVEVATAAMNAGLNTVSSGFFAVGGSGTARFVGTIDEVGFWKDNPPSAADIAEIQATRTETMVAAWTALGGTEADFITEAHAKANLSTVFTERFEATAGYGKGNIYMVAQDKIILPTNRLVDGPFPGRNTTALIDYEVADGRTEAETTQLFTDLASDVHRAGKKIAVYTNPLTNAIQKHHGIGANLPTLLGLVDYMGLMLASVNKEATIQEAYNAAIAALGVDTPAEWAKIMITFGVGNSLTQMDISAAQFVHGLLAGPAASSPKIVNFWRFFGLPGGKPTRDFNQRESTVVYGTATPPTP